MTVDSKRLTAAASLHVENARASRISIGYANNNGFDHDRR